MAKRIERAFSVRRPDLEDLAALLSPAASPFLEQMANQAQRLTRQHFGKIIELFIPLYLSNHCVSGCSYCGFASDRPIERKRLTLEEIDQEVLTLAQEGYDEILLLTGESCGAEDFLYLLEAIKRCRRFFNRVTVEAFPMELGNYRRLVEAGLFSVTVYQETYQRELYEKVHRWGKKQDFGYRLDTPERALEAGSRGVGLGVLLGLGEPREDLICLAAHLQWLYQRHWDALFSVSFPRLRPEVGGFSGTYAVTNREQAQFIYAFRIVFPKFHLVLSTRETEAMRDNLAGVGISKMSVGSRTTVGGYHQASGGACQFEIADHRSREAFCAALAQRGLMGVYKNWDRSLR
ncbi:MAG: 2-iminoacetate synthase ThiH [Deltaproteobacteria bacterium]|nr:2-iminoacetate synthase ThiH [Deltaproteobacteria bacterium]